TRLSTLSLHDALPISLLTARRLQPGERRRRKAAHLVAPRVEQVTAEVETQRGFFFTQTRLQIPRGHTCQFKLDDIACIVGKQRKDRKSTRLNSSHVKI